MNDDVVLKTAAMEEMLAFWATAPPEVGEASFNLLNYPPLAVGGWLGTTASIWRREILLVGLVKSLWAT